MRNKLKRMRKKRTIQLDAYVKAFLAQRLIDIARLEANEDFSEPPLLSFADWQRQVALDAEIAAAVKAIKKD